MTETTTAPENDIPNLTFAVQKIYLKDLSFETPTAREVFKQAWKPNIQQDLNIQVNSIEADIYEVMILLTVAAHQEEKPVFIVEVKQAGIFTIGGLEGLQLSHAINTLCPQILFPYLREVVDSTLIKGGFPPLMLSPLNFDAIFAQAVMAAHEQAAKAEVAASDAPAVAPESLN